MDELSVRIQGDVSIVVPASLASLSAYVFLEQETWFEKEVAFIKRWLRPGMVVIDIGANVGAYSLPMARRVAPAGRVFAYEPASEPRQMLEHSRTLNGLVNLEIAADALSDHIGEALLTFGESSELNALGKAGRGERVTLTTLDREDAKDRWPSPDFVKIDAEGEEERILAGGCRFFKRHSPLLMFEVKTREAVNYQLADCVRALGYATYRQLGGEPVLVPYAPGEALDKYELNLFAARPQRAAALEAEGLLVTHSASGAACEPDAQRALEVLRAQAFAGDFAELLDENVNLDPHYRRALAAYATWKTAELPVTARTMALNDAFEAGYAACRGGITFSRLLTFARIAAEAGQRAASLEALSLFLDRIQESELVLSEPFWPACPHYDSIPTGGDNGNWIVAGAVEQMERTGEFSSRFGRANPHLEWLCKRPFATIEMERRRVLRKIVSGERIRVPARLESPGPDHLNADLWRNGRVPGMFV